MYRFKWPVKFSSPVKKIGRILKTAGNARPFGMIARMSKRTLAFTAIIVMLLAVNGVFWFFRMTHQDANPGTENTPKLKEWQINLNETRMDEKELKKEYTLPGSQNKSEVDDKKMKENIGAVDREPQKMSSGNQAGFEKKEQPVSQSPGNTSGDNSPGVETAAAITQPTLTTMAMPAVGKVIADYAVDKLIYSKTLEQWNSHHGIDIAAEEGTPVKSAMDGTVVEVRSGDPRLGVVIVIDHGGDIRTLYGNLSSDKLVQKGKYVKKGQIIGAVGKTAPYEIEDPPHLHFEVLKGKENIDPQQYLPKLN